VKIEGRTNAGLTFSEHFYMIFDEKGKVVKSVQPIKTPIRTRSYFQVCGVWERWKDGKGISFKNRLKLARGKKLERNLNG
jgi:hypothetical protein